MEVALVLYTAVLPAAVAGVLLLVGGRRHADFALGATAAFLIAYLFDNGWRWPAYPPVDSKSSVALPVLLAAVVGAFPQRWLRRGLSLAPAFLIAYFVMSTKKSVGVAWLGAGIIVAWTWAAEALATRRPGSVIPFTWMVALTLAASSLPLLGYASGAQYLGSLAAACGAWFLFAELRQLTQAHGHPVKAIRQRAHLVVGFHGNLDIGAALRHERRSMGEFFDRPR